MKDKAARVLMHMGQQVSVQDILHKFESVFGCVDRGQTILSSFYSAKQGDAEDVTSFANRLEDLLSKAVETGKIKPTDTNDMLCSVFYSGLNQQLKSISGYKFDQFNTFDKLRVEVRRLEAEMSSTRTHSKAVTASKDEQIEKLTGVVNQLRTEVNEFKTKFSENRGRSSFRAHPRGNRGRSINYNSRYYSHSSNDSISEVTCHRCGQKGHIQLGCRVRLDHQGRQFNRPLNFNASMRKGHS